MTDENIQEQPQATFLSDFNDLHVEAGIEVVREQIESGILTQSSAFADPPHPLENAGHSLGQSGENEPDFPPLEPDFNDGRPDYELEMSPDLSAPPDLLESGQPVQQGSGEIIEFERPDYTLEKCLARLCWSKARPMCMTHLKRK